jgi:PTH1 family peptidyl-tRNA hydrolase
MIVGLGNPGKQYENTRHNLGWFAIDELARRAAASFDEQQHKALIAKTTLQNKRVLLVKPQTFMNLSGESVQPLASFYKVAPADILVLYDELDLPFGTLRLRANGSAGGQNGMKSILQRLATQDIARVRLGIGRPPGKMDPSAWVLKAFEGDEAITAAKLADRAADAAETWLLGGIEHAMTSHNTVTAESPRVGVVAPKPASERLASSIMTMAAPDKKKKQPPQQKVTAAMPDKNQAFEETYLFPLKAIETAIVTVYRRLPDTKDHHVQKALEALTRTYSAALRERAAPTLHLDATSNQLREAIRLALEAEMTQGTNGQTISLEESVQCLKRIERSVEQHGKLRGIGSNHYLEFVQQFILDAGG